MGAHDPNGNDPNLVVLDAAEAWDTELSLNPVGTPFFGEAFKRIGELLGLSEHRDLPDGTIMRRENDGGSATEEIYLAIMMLFMDSTFSARTTKT